MQNSNELDFSDVMLSAIFNNVIKPKANLQLPDPRLVEIYENENSRIVWLEDDIDQTSLSVTKQIMKYNLEDKKIPISERKPIKLFINTRGGDVDVMMAIISAIRMSNTPVWTINWCNALSAGAHILAAGHKRFAIKNSTVLIHSGSCSYSGTAEMVESAKKYYDAQGKLANDLLLASTKIDPKVFKKKSSQEWYLSSEEALQYGVVDKVLDSFDELF